MCATFHAPRPRLRASRTARGSRVHPLSHHDKSARLLRKRRRVLQIVHFGSRTMSWLKTKPSTYKTPHTYFFLCHEYRALLHWRNRAILLCSSLHLHGQTYMHRELLWWMSPSYYERHWVWGSVHGMLVVRKLVIPLYMSFRLETEVVNQSTSRLSIRRATRVCIHP